MTICIAAICNGGKNVVAVADKMITYAALPYHQFEHPKPKIHKLTQSSILMTAGSALLPSEFLELIKSGLSRITTSSIKDLAQVAKEAYKELRREIISDRILGRYNISWEGYKQFIYGRGATEIQYRIIGVIEDFRLELEAIIAGVDSNGAHIYYIENPGELSSFDNIGYTAIGSGEYHAVRSFIENNYSINFSLEKALYVVYEAKKYAECAPGVGKDTELVIIGEEGITTIDKEALDILEEMYNEKLRILSDALAKEMQKYLEDLKEMLSSKNTLSLDK